MKLPHLANHSGCLNGVCASTQECVSLHLFILDYLKALPSQLLLVLFAGKPRWPERKRQIK